MQTLEWRALLLGDGIFDQLYIIQRHEGRDGKLMSDDELTTQVQVGARSVGLEGFVEVMRNCQPECWPPQVELQSPHQLQDEDEQLVAFVDVHAWRSGCVQEKLKLLQGQIVGVLQPVFQRA